MAKAETSEVRLGLTDGYRYIGIKPPLSPGEAQELAVSGLIDGPLEQVGINPVCTLIQIGVSSVTPKAATEGTILRASKIGVALRGLRRGIVTVDLNPVPLLGYQSSPWNPNTDNKQQSIRRRGRK